MNRKQKRQAIKEARKFINGYSVPKKQRMQMADRKAKKIQKARMSGDTIIIVSTDEVKEDEL